jgi:hypothetical protein
MNDPNIGGQQDEGPEDSLMLDGYEEEERGTGREDDGEMLVPEYFGIRMHVAAGERPWNYKVADTNAMYRAAVQDKEGLYGYALGEIVSMSSREIMWSLSRAKESETELLHLVSDLFIAYGHDINIYNSNVEDWMVRWIVACSDEMPHRTDEATMEEVLYVVVSLISAVTSRHGVWHREPKLKAPKKEVAVAARLVRGPFEEVFVDTEGYKVGGFGTRRILPSPRVSLDCFKSLKSMLPREWARNRSGRKNPMVINHVQGVKYASAESDMYMRAGVGWLGTRELDAIESMVVQLLGNETRSLLNTTALTLIEDVFEGLERYCTLIEFIMGIHVEGINGEYEEHRFFSGVSERLEECGVMVSPFSLTVAVIAYPHTIVGDYGTGKPTLAEWVACWATAGCNSSYGYTSHRDMMLNRNQLPIRTTAYAETRCVDSPVSRLTLIPADSIFLNLDAPAWFIRMYYSYMNMQGGPGNVGYAYSYLTLMPGEFEWPDIKGLNRLQPPRNDYVEPYMWYVLERIAEGKNKSLGRLQEEFCYATSFKKHFPHASTYIPHFLLPDAYSFPHFQGEGVRRDGQAWSRSGFTKAYCRRGVDVLEPRERYILALGTHNLYEVGHYVRLQLGQTPPIDSDNIVDIAAAFSSRWADDDPQDYHLASKKTGGLPATTCAGHDIREFEDIAEMVDCVGNEVEMNKRREMFADLHLYGSGADKWSPKLASLATAAAAYPAANGSAALLAALHLGKVHDRFRAPYRTGYIPGETYTCVFRNIGARTLAKLIHCKFERGKGYGAEALACIGLRFHTDGVETTMTCGGGVFSENVCGVRMSWRGHLGHVEEYVSDCGTEHLKYHVLGLQWIGNPQVARAKMVNVVVLRDADERITAYRPLYLKMQNVEKCGVVKRTCGSRCELAEIDKHLLAITRSCVRTRRTAWTRVTTTEIISGDAAEQQQDINDVISLNTGARIRIREGSVCDKTWLKRVLIERGF